LDGLTRTEPPAAAKQVSKIGRTGVVSAARAAVSATVESGYTVMGILVVGFLFRSSFRPVEYLGSWQNLSKR
jgi:hypothetical protein